MVELKGIRKYFSSNNVTALDGADFNLREKEIHALLGENGAGKSTLMHIMAGFIKSDSGVITVDGKEQRFSSPAGGLAEGIGMIRQQPYHVPGFLVWESCVVGAEQNSFLWLNRRHYREEVKKLNDRLGFELPLDVPAETLTVSQGQKAAILGMLLQNVQYLIFDEPTAVLTPTETQNLFKLFVTLRSQRKGIVLISHKLDETLKIADRITVLRQGKTQICCTRRELSGDELYNRIFGKALLFPIAQQAHSSGAAEDDKQKQPVLVLRDFEVNVPGRPIIRGINLELERGKILGVAGVRDSGLETLELAITGFLPWSGTLCVNGTKLAANGGSSAKRINAFRVTGGVYLGAKNEGTTLSIRDMLLIHAHRRFQKRGVLDKRAINEWIQKIMDKAGIPYNATVHGSVYGSALSGGQLQRLLLAREMAEPGALLVLSDPCRGLDRQYRQSAAALLQKKTADGSAVLIFSTDTEELLTLSDSVAVLRDGVLSRVLSDKNSLTLDAIREAMVGRA